MTQPQLTALDHLVLTVADIDRTVTFYRDALGMTPERFATADGTQRWALKYGAAKINLHEAGHEFEPKAERPTPGSADLCFLTDTPLDVWAAHLARQDILIEEGPVNRTGARFALTSLYIRDPDQNLIEIAIKRSP